ncbi:bifunctional helix-turn-helix transcriptional regulator/GNAT family N-acetyltransferase [Sulfurospirillum halorespirans]|uniref:MarR family transcriptional regulator n=1 Tax=Sulfurospirillum halorespirans DSM 13726 TaxID=1193502 RepID=A0A1D7TIA8_9BACT|nr:helix-turn-helix domain-containing GNAT family N-acetyltransferase [Sulfurospirillum halorespirans]AOO64716.1 MarR family transcriptional regulator [Sulfurospirillum halorespirans DSM 13726]
MNTDPSSTINQIRTASRHMVRELGFMEKTLAGTNYSPSAVHALLEIEKQGAMTALQLVHTLSLEKSSVSRMVNKLIKTGEVIENTDPKDGRIKNLLLTKQGEKTVEAIHLYGQKQVKTAMEHLDVSQQQAVVQGLCTYAEALQGCRLTTPNTTLNAITLDSGYRPGVVGRVTEMHATFYAHSSHFGQFFESKVAMGMAEFVSRLNNPRNNLWMARYNDTIVGSIAIDGEDLGDNNAHLRWFIMDEKCQGQGIGRQLLHEAVIFCEKSGFDAIELWTFKGLHAARKLYESFGFELIKEENGNQWGSVVTEQQFRWVIAKK